MIGHTIDGQRSYGWVTRWRLSLPPGTGPITMPPKVEALANAELAGEEADGLGTLAELRSRMDACLDEWALRLGTTPDDQLAKPALWSNTPVDISFRLGRWSSHIAEHTVQLDKTLDWLDHQPTEVARIVRDLHAAWGRLESRLFLRRLPHPRSTRFSPAWRVPSSPKRAAPAPPPWDSAPHPRTHVGSGLRGSDHPGLVVESRLEAGQMVLSES